MIYIFLGVLLLFLVFTEYIIRKKNKAPKLGDSFICSGCGGSSSTQIEL